MHDLKQLRADAEFVLRDRENYPYGSAAFNLAAFVRDITDDTPAGAEWLESVYPPTDDGWSRFQVYKNGSCYFCRRDTASTFIGLHITRGRVRAFALAMGLALTEGEG